MASDDDFFILRRFAPESARVALWLQDRISQLTAELKEADKQYEDFGWHSGQFRTDKVEDRRHDIMNKMALELDRYR